MVTIGIASRPSCLATVTDNNQLPLVLTRFVLLCVCYCARTNTHSPKLARTVQSMAIEDIVEELCWDEEEQGDDDDDDDDVAAKVVRCNASVVASAHHSRGTHDSPDAPPPHLTQPPEKVAAEALGVLSRKQQRLAKRAKGVAPSLELASRLSLRIQDPPHTSTHLQDPPHISNP